MRKAWNDEKEGEREGQRRERGKGESVCERERTDMQIWLQGLGTHPDALLLADVAAVAVALAEAKGCFVCQACCAC